MTVRFDDIFNGADGTITNKHEKDLHDYHRIRCFTQTFPEKKRTNDIHVAKRKTSVYEANCPNDDLWIKTT